MNNSEVQFVKETKAEVVDCKKKNEEGDKTKIRLPKENNNLVDEEECKYYDTGKHRRRIVWKMLGVAVILAIGIPFLLAVLNWLLGLLGFRDTSYSIMNGTNDSSIITARSAFFDAGILPDFLGGFAGILVGYFLESHYFKQLNILRKFEGVKILLKEELNGVLKLIDKWSNAGEENQKRYNLYFVTPVISNVLDDVEDSYVIYNLPTNNKKGNILKKIQNINLLLTEIMFHTVNKIDYDGNNFTMRKEKYKDLKKHIEDLYIIFFNEKEKN